MKSASSKSLRALAIALLVVVVCALGWGSWFYFRLQKSLPQLDGSARLPGLGARVIVERDALGVVTLRGESRLDVARALGYAHAQDRFFQMDLARRQAAGELAELLGRDGLPLDRKNRIHEFRTRAGAVLARLPESQRALLFAYSEGVNAGLAALTSKPFEYVLLRTEPAPWRPEDSILAIYAEALELQSGSIDFEHSLATMGDNFGKTAVAYFAPPMGPDDAALDGSTAPLGPMPTERQIDIRKRVYEFEDNKKHASLSRFDSPSVVPGSNAFALAGNHSTTGSAILANDLHRGLTVPNHWYRASLHFRTASGEVRVTGITLPGLPLILAGSNGHVAWGLANACADTADLVVVNPASGPGTYMEMDTPKMYEKHAHTLLVRGGKPESIEYSWTTWGPIIGTNADKRDYALKWTLHDPQAINLGLVDMETASSAQEAVAVAHHSGLPVQSVVIADSQGAIAWTLCGAIPIRLRYEGRLPATWAFGDRKWIRYLNPDEIPTQLEPAAGRLWAANQRMLGGDFLNVLGDGGYALPYRAARIRDDLAALEKSTERDFLAVQLDAHAPFLNRWQQLLLNVLSTEVTAQKRERAQMRTFVEKWEAEAATPSISYRLVAAFRQHVVDRVMPVVMEPCYDVYPNFDFSRFNYEPALWDMIEKRPPHLIGQEYGSWDDLLLAAADDVIADVKKEQGALKAGTWGDHNRAQIRHPLAKLFPGPLGWWLRMPTDPLAGDNNTPRVQTPDFGASERLVVSPGHEQSGLYEMPCGQSGHPLSPFFRAGHDAWVKGEATPFLPGPSAHILQLVP